MGKIRCICRYGAQMPQYIQIRIPKDFVDMFPWRHVEIEELPDRSGIVVKPFKIVE